MATIQVTITPTSSFIEDGFDYVVQNMNWNNIPTNSYLTIIIPNVGETVVGTTIEQQLLPSNVMATASSIGIYASDYYDYHSGGNDFRTTDIFPITFVVKRNGQVISNVVKLNMKIKPQPPTFDTTPTYEDINNDSLVLTNDNQMIVNGLSTIKISNLKGSAYKGGTLTKVNVKTKNGPINTPYSIVEHNSYWIRIYDFESLYKNLIITLIDSRGWTNSYELADISKFKYIWQTLKINNYTVEHDNVSETTPLTASGVYSEGYQLGTTTVEASYSYKENVEGSTETSGVSTLNITKTPTYDYNNFLSILDEYNVPTYQTDSENLQYYDKQTFENGINNLFSSAIFYNDKYTQEYLQADYDSTNERYYCKSGDYNGSWKKFWRETLELIYDKIIENGGNYEWSIEEPAIQGNLQSGFSIDKTFNVKLSMQTILNGITTTIESQVFLPTAIPAIDVYKDNVSIHGLYDETLGGTQINSDLYVNGKKLFQENILWQGVSYMNQTQSATLTKKVSETKHGIVLVWSGYSGGAQNNNFYTYFVPKEIVNLHAGSGFFMSMGGTEGIIAYKYVYINDNIITGNANNSGNHSHGGLSYTNSSMVLRYVIEV